MPLLPVILVALAAVFKLAAVSSWQARNLKSMHELSASKAHKLDYSSIGIMLMMVGQGPLICIFKLSG